MGNWWEIRLWWEIKFYGKDFSLGALKPLSKLSVVAKLKKTRMKFQKWPTTESLDEREGNVSCWSMLQTYREGWQEGIERLYKA